LEIWNRKSEIRNGENMDYGKILARAFEITYRYRVLWLFGFLLALFGGSGGGNFNPGSFGNGATSSSRGGNGDFGDVLPNLPSTFWQNIAVIIAVVVCVVLILSVLGIIARFVSRGALIGLVQELETGGTTPTVRRGFSIGASRFWQLLGIAIIVNLPLTIFSFAVILLAALPLVLAIVPALSRNPRSDAFAPLLAGGIIGSVAMICCAGLGLWVIAIIVRPFYEFIVRVCVVEKRGVFDSIREGFRLVRANLGNVVILYLLVIGIGIGFGILMIPVGLLLIGIPVGVAVVVGGVSNAIAPAIIAGVVVGIPFLLVLVFIGGLYHIFESTVWTEGYLAIPKPTAPATPVLSPNQLTAG
jgi:hypothetical protein